MDFYKIKKKKLTSNNREADYIVYPDFNYAGIKDLVCKGGSMYAFWTGEKWSTSKDDLVITVDKAVRKRVGELREKEPDKDIYGRMMNDNETKIMSQFEQYTKQMSQSDVVFNNRIIFANEAMTRDDYATAQLNYYPIEGDTPAFDELLGLLYEDVELEKILWFIGATLTNNMAKIQKFMYLYGGAGSGKGTVIKIIKMIFEGYHATIDLATLTGGSDFASSQVKEVPLLIDDDCDLSRITKDVTLLKLTAHEPITVNAKFKSEFEVTFNGLLVTASNQRFQVRNIDSGIMRRAIVVEPTNYTHESEDYFRLMDMIKFEVPHIAQKAITMFNEKGPYYYENYRDIAMAEATDYVFSFVRENATQLGDVVTLKRVSALYKLYLEDLGYDTKGHKRRIKTEMQRYYRNYYDKTRVDGEQVRNVYSGFKSEIVFPDMDEEERNRKFARKVEIEGDRPETNHERPGRLLSDDKGTGGTLVLDHEPGVFETYARTFPAQYASGSGTPKTKWDETRTTMADIESSKLHFVQLPSNHIVIDFDLKSESGEKSLERNIEAASKFPPTYAEISKSGKGIHLHYTYGGDVSKLANLYDDDIEIKKWTGNASLRRKFTKSNGLKIAHISAGLPYKEKEGVKVYDNIDIVWDERKIRKSIIGNLENKYHANTKPSIDFIDKILKEAEAAGIKYDVSDLRNPTVRKAMQSTNNSAYCLELITQMPWKTTPDSMDPIADPVVDPVTKVLSKEDLYCLDVEIYPNLFVICVRSYDNSYRKAYINPTAVEVEKLIELPFFGHNVRGYDNHILYGAMLGKSNIELFNQSQGIIERKDKHARYFAANELSYADTYEISVKKQSLKKWQIELGITHDEIELPWDQPVPEELWPRVVDYCWNDVDSNVAVFDAIEGDYTARCILAELSGLSVNAKTQDHAAAFLFGDKRRPQDEFEYTHLETIFPGYKFDRFKGSTYKGEKPSEGGYVYSKPGVYQCVYVLDIASMHPTSLVEMNYFGPYTQRFADLMRTRLYIKHKDFESARKMFDGVLVPYLDNEKDAKNLSNALKIIINIIYGMTSAKFDNKFKHPDNIDNIVAKRGALFMILLKAEMEERGIELIHTKTDSVKLVNPTEEQVQWVIDFGKEYGYDFEIEHIYKRAALVNKAVLIGEYYDEDEGKNVWEPVGSQFREPYVYKTLFSGDPIVTDDFFITKEVKKSKIYIGDKHIGRFARMYASKTGEVVESRNDEGKVSAVNGTKGFLWKEASEFVDKEDIDFTYYNQLVENAVKAINKVGDERIIIDNQMYWITKDEEVVEDDNKIISLDEYKKSKGLDKSEHDTIDILDDTLLSKISKS